MTHTIEHAKKAHRKARKEGCVLSLRTFARTRAGLYAGEQSPKLAQILRVQLIPVPV